MPAGPSAVLPETKPTALPIALRLVTMPVAVRKFNEATVHVSSRENTAQLALAVLSVPSLDVREVLHLLHGLWLKLDEGRRLILAE